MTEAQTVDVIVAGGGPAGLSAGLALAAQGLEVTIVDPLEDPGDDRRTSALMTASVTMLRELGVWQRCVDAAAPLKTMRIIDDTGRLFRAPTVAFEAREIGEPAFGWNVPNAALVSALRDQIAEAEAIALIHSVVEQVEPEQDRVTVTLADGTRRSAALLVGADGRNSACRAAAGIDTDSWAYDQAAIVLNLRHDRPHGGVSTEFHRPPGPFTLVPLPGDRSSLVWVETRNMAEAVSTYSDQELAREIERISHRILGRVAIDGPRGSYPLTGLIARRYAAKRIPLVGEAAHVVPPIGAQGLNLGLRDGAALAELAGDPALSGGDPGSAAVLTAYDRRRRVDILSRTAAIDMLNRTLLADLIPAQMLRSAGLAALGWIGPVRRMAMREGVAPRYGLPVMMRGSSAESSAV